MDTAVGLVQAYLNVNGYFTVADYPVLEAFRRGSARTVTDLDILAFRFAAAGHEVIHGQGHRPLAGRVFEPDPALACPTDRPDMIIGEVKEGAARFNSATRDPNVVEIALARFGCCGSENAGDLARALLERGRIDGPSGHVLRMVAFGSVPDAGARGHWHTVPMRHVIDFLRSYLRQHWEVLRHAQIKDSTLGLLTLLEKCGLEGASAVESGLQTQTRERERLPGSRRSAK